VWADEFEGTSVDQTKWEFQIGDGRAYGLPSGWGNNELQWYRAENATVENGQLTITAKREPFETKAYTSVRMRTANKGEWKYGRFEMRAKLPLGQGIWPAFWMLPTDSIYGGWAASGEIDIMELVGHEPSRVVGTIHYGGSWPQNVFTNASYSLPNGTFADEFHRFAIEWEPGEMRWYVDGVHYQTQSNWWTTGGRFPAPFDQRFHLLLNLAVGGNWPGSPNEITVFPQTMVVDYVRVYRSLNQAPRVTIAGPAERVLPGARLTLTADATDADGTVEKVEFFQGDAKLGEATKSPYELTLAKVFEGCYAIRAAARDNCGTGVKSETVNLTVGSCAQAPYLMTPAVVPGTIEAENFDLGGQGVAYNDRNPQANNGDQSGNNYRTTEGVDIQPTNDTGGGHNIGWIEAGEWLEYLVEIKESSAYSIAARVASPNAGGSLIVEVDGKDMTGAMSVPTTGGWQNWTTITKGDVRLAAGVHTLRVVFPSGGFNLNKLTISGPN
jgi:beta-glucanase (GH16 family)